MFIFNLHCQLVLRVSDMLHKNTCQCKISIVPEEGWFGQPKYSTPSKKAFYVVSVSAFMFFNKYKQAFNIGFDYLQKIWLLNILYNLHATSM